MRPGPIQSPRMARFRQWTAACVAEGVASRPGQVVLTVNWPAGMESDRARGSVDSSREP